MMMNECGGQRARRAASRSLLAPTHLHAARAEAAAEEHAIFQAQDDVAAFQLGGPNTAPMDSCSTRATGSSESHN
jgi:hypothetical protein